MCVNVENVVMDISPANLTHSAWNGKSTEYLCFLSHSSICCQVYWLTREKKCETALCLFPSCAPWGVKVGGSRTSDVVCNNGSEVTQTGVLSTAVNLNYSHSLLTSAETSPTTAAPGSSLTPPPVRTATTTTTKSVNDTNYSSGELFFLCYILHSRCQIIVNSRQFCFLLF